VVSSKKTGRRMMIRFFLKEIIAEQEFKTGKRITNEQVARETGIHKMTISRIGGVRGYNTTTDNIDKLCRYFGVPVEKIMGYVPDEEISEKVAEETN
jgi:DNA-binding Xre family transcriptional regulator